MTRIVAHESKVPRIAARESTGVRGIVTITLFDRDGNEVTVSRHNLIMDALRSRLLKRLNGDSLGTNETAAIDRIAFGTSATAPVVANTRLGLELSRKALTSKIISGTHWIADANIAFAELNGAQTTISAIGSATSITVASSTGLRIGDYIEVNAVSTVGVTANQQFATIQNIAGNVLTLAGAGLNLAAVVPPANGWYVMQLVQEIGALMDVQLTTVTAGPTTTVLPLSSVYGLFAGDQVRVQIGAAYEYRIIQTVGASSITLTAALSTPPAVGALVEAGTLANHATGFAFRKTNALTAVARIDIAFN